MIHVDLVIGGYVRLISTVHVLQECLAGVYGNNGISFIIIE
jgi:hypothetical protein